MEEMEILDMVMERTEWGKTALQWSVPDSDATKRYMHRYSATSTGGICTVTVQQAQEVGSCVALLVLPLIPPARLLDTDQTSV
eukprot:1156204-Pelagomonas_calceolata.AAC.5